MRRAALLLALLFGAAGCARPAAGPEPSPPAPSPTSSPTPRRAAPRESERDAMVRDQIEARGVRDPRVLAAMRTVPRHEFVPEAYAAEAYDDEPVPIGYGQTISQPYIVASMTEEARVEPGEKVLEIGTGSGYQAAVLAEITGEVFTIEIVEGLADKAAERLRKLGYERVRTRHADGWWGWREGAPFDAIVVTAAASQVPPPLVEQLAKGGRMVIPVGNPYALQTLMVVTKDEKGEVHTESLYDVRFVPFTRAAGAGPEGE